MTTRTAVPYALKRRLQRASDAERKAQAALDEARARLTRELHAAHAESYSIRALAEATGRSATRVHGLLNND